MTQRAFMILNAVTCLAAFTFLFWLIYFRQGSGGGESFHFLPAVNASLNALTAAFLIRGYLAIKANNPRLHSFCMRTAFIVSTLFLVCYILHHKFNGDTPFPGQGAIRPVYFSILISHIVLSMVALPMVFGTFFFALTGNLVTHRKWARITLPIWLYVSLTGVAIYFFLKTYI